MVKFTVAQKFKMKGSALVIYLGLVPYLLVYKTIPVHCLPVQSMFSSVCSYKVIPHLNCFSELTRIPYCVQQLLTSCEHVTLYGWYSFPCCEGENQCKKLNYVRF